MLSGAWIVVRAHRKRKPTPEELEAQRRDWLSQFGKLGGGEILEVGEDYISYLYGVRGMSYSAFQDVSGLEERLPSDRWSIVGGVGVRFDPRNPANSIVISETWTGLRKREQPDG